MGIVTGTALKLTSSILASLAGMHDEPSRLEIVKESNTSEEQLIKKSEDGQSSQESEWQWLEKTPEPNSRRRRTGGLLAQTILEEDDDS
jgi:hypothetical protein